MTSPGWIGIIRGVLLVGLFLFFVTSLCCSLVAEQGHLVFASQSARPGRDPGVRVLLVDREKLRIKHSSLTIRLLQPCELVCPDNPEQWYLQLPEGTSLTLEPRPATNGIHIAAPGLPDGSFGSAGYGQAQRLHLKPVNHSSTVDNDGSAPDIARQEAADRRAVFAIGKRSYRGNLEVVVESGNWLYAVNALPIEAYVESALQWEMGSQFPTAALRAQAIILRSWAYTRRLRGKTSLDGLLRYDMQDCNPDPNYHGAGVGDQITAGASIDTRGLILTVRDQPFLPHFHRSSGGKTAGVAELDPSAATLDGTPLRSTIVPVKDDFCERSARELDRLSTYWSHSEAISRKQLSEALKNAGHIDSGHANRISVTRHPSGRIDKVSISVLHRDVPVILSAEDFRRAIGPERIRSALWSDESPRDDHQNGTFIIESLGAGHGVGLSQISTWAMGNDGFSSGEILRFFYGELTKVSQAW